MAGQKPAMTTPRRTFNPARKLAGSLLGTGAAQPPPPPLPKVRIVMPPAAPAAAGAGGSPPTNGSDLPPFRPLQRLDDDKLNQSYLMPPSQNSGRTRKITRSASVVSLVPTGVNPEGETVMSIMTGNRKLLKDWKEALRSVN